MSRPEIPRWRYHNTKSLNDFALCRCQERGRQCRNEECRRNLRRERYHHNFARSTPEMVCVQWQGRRTSLSIRELDILF